MEFLFSDEIRSKIDKMEIGNVFKMHDIGDLLKIHQSEYKTRSPRINAILLEKVLLGSLVKVKVGTYKKIKTVKTVKKQTGTRRNIKPIEKHRER